MRIMLPKRLLPTLHESSFNAYKAMPNSSMQSGDADTSLEVGYLTQAERVGVAISAVIERANTEGVSIIVEGVHMHPEMMHTLESNSDAIFVPLIIASPKRKNLRKQLKGRGQQLSSRRSQRYMDNFESIWALQSFLIAEAEKYDTAIIPGTDLQDATALVMEYISQVLAENFDGDPAELLHASPEDLAEAE
jgi:2-phosphoglycerate kinase